MTSISRLPLEILYQTFCAVAERNDRPTLSNCSLTCRATRYTCQGHLFNASELTFPSSNNEVDQLAALIEANHCLSQRIHDISFKVRLPDGQNPQDELRALFRLFDSLTPSRIQRLSFTVFPAFEPVPQIFTSRVQKLIIDAGPSLQVLETFNRPFPLSFLRALPPLKVLELRGGRILNDVQEDTVCAESCAGGERTSSNGPLQVEHLSISGRSAEGVSGKDVLDYDSIKKCSIDAGIYDHDFIMMPKGILRKMTGLVSLSLTVYDEDIQGLFPALEKHICSTLQNLEVRLSVGPFQDSYGETDMFLSLFRLLAHFPKASALTSLDVSVRMSYQFTPESGLRLFEREQWEMPGVVLDASAFPGLHRVRFAYNIVDNGDSRHGLVFVEQLRSGSFKALRTWVPDVSCAVTYTNSKDHLEPVEEYIIE